MRITFQSSTLTVCLRSFAPQSCAPIKFAFFYYKASGFLGGLFKAVAVKFGQTALKENALTRSSFYFHKPAVAVLHHAFNCCLVRWTGRTQSEFFPCSLIQQKSG